jgi:hypothetical protein
MRSTRWRNQGDCLGAQWRGPQAWGGGDKNDHKIFASTIWANNGPSLSYRGSENLQQASSQKQELVTL